MGNGPSAVRIINRWPGENVRRDRILVDVQVQSAPHCFGGGVGRFLSNSGYTYPAGSARSGSGRTLRYVT